MGERPTAELRKTNLQGTGHARLELAQAAQADHGLARYAHVSTAYVAGGRTGPVPEDALTDAYGFSCSHEFSKYEGERLVQAVRAAKTPRWAGPARAACTRRSPSYLLNS